MKRNKKDLYPFPFPFPFPSNVHAYAVVSLGLCLFTYLGHVAMNTGNCIKVEPSSFEIGVCSGQQALK